MKTILPFFVYVVFAFSFWLQPLEVFARTPNLAKSWHQVYAEAWSHLESNENEEAEILLKEALDSSGNDFYLNLMTLDMLEETYERRAQFQNARKTLLQSLITLKSNHFCPKKYAGFIYLKLALVNYQLKDFHKAGFFALLAAPSLRDSDYDRETVITIKRLRKNIKLSHF